MITFNQLASFLPAGSIEFVGNNQVKINFSQLTGDTLSLDSSCVKGIVKLLKGLAALTASINAFREAATPPLPTIDFVSDQLVGTSDNPRIQLVTEVQINTSSFVDNLIDAA